MNGFVPLLARTLPLRRRNRVASIVLDEIGIFFPFRMRIEAGVPRVVRPASNNHGPALSSKLFVERLADIICRHQYPLLLHFFAQDFPHPVAQLCLPKATFEGDSHSSLLVQVDLQGQYPVVWKQRPVAKKEGGE
jgi:hypothetical protein